MALLLVLVGGCATKPAADPQDLTTTSVTHAACRTRDAADLQSQEDDVRVALGEVDAWYAAEDLRLDQAEELPAREREARLDMLRADYERRLRSGLEPLAANGNGAAMLRLAVTIRDSHEPTDIRHWLSLVRCASSLAYPAADDELIRWYWHQRGDGSIEAVQRNRARALELAGKMVADGSVAGLERIGIYIAGDVHQFPANPPLAHRVLALCARLDWERCQRELAGLGRYSYGQSPVEAYVWLSRLARRQPEALETRRDRAWSSLSATDRQAVGKTELALRPARWIELSSEWAELRRDILAAGASSVGLTPTCTTPTPWCRGQLIGEP